jgi:hypothetical protein
MVLPQLPSRDTVPLIAFIYFYSFPISHREVVTFIYAGVLSAPDGHNN